MVIGNQAASLKAQYHPEQTSEEHQILNNDPIYMNG